MPKYYKPNMEYHKKTKAQAGSSGWWDPQKNQKNEIRILPAFDERGIVVLRRVIHYGFEEDGRKRAFPCLEDNMPWLPKQPCPICHVVRKMVMGQVDEREAAKELDSGSPRYVVQIIDCRSPDSGVQKYAGPHSFGKYVLSLLEDDDLGDITHPEKGYNLIIEVSGKGRGTSYDYRLRPKPTPIPYTEWEHGLGDLIKEIDVRNGGELIELLKTNYSAFDLEDYLSDFKGAKKEKPGQGSSRTESLTQVEIDELSKSELLDLAAKLGIDEEEHGGRRSKLKKLIAEELESAPF